MDETNESKKMGKAGMLTKLRYAFIIVHENFTLIKFLSVTAIENKLLH